MPFETENVPESRFSQVTNPLTRSAMQVGAPRAWLALPTPSRPMSEMVVKVEFVASAAVIVFVPSA